MASVTALHPSLGITATVPVGQTHINDSSNLKATSSDPVPRGPVKTILNFFKAPEDGSTPFNFVESPPEGQPQRNYGDENVEVAIQDARGKEQEFSLDKNSFALLRNYHSNSAIDWDDDESVKTLYYPEVEKLLIAENPGAYKVFIFDHTVRRAGGKAKRSPVTRAHIDQTETSAKNRVKYHLPEESEKLLEGRHRLINVWRPINGKVESHPLSFADGSTVPLSDTVPVEHRYPDRTGETAGVKHNSQHNWWYLSGIDNDERILLQCYDSKYPINRTPHSAFVDSRSGPDSKPRESIEVRALVFG